jgi:hypothetical protein
LDFSVAHGGFNDVKNHCNSKAHVTKASALQNSTSMLAYVEKKEDGDLRTIRAEAYFAAFFGGT